MAKAQVPARFRQWRVCRLNLTPPGTAAPVAPLVVVLSADNSNRVHGSAVVSEVIRFSGRELGPTEVRLSSQEVGQEVEGVMDTAHLMTVPLGTLVEEAGRLGGEGIAKARAALVLAFEDDAWRGTL